MQINESLIKEVAKNARLELTKEEIKEFLPQLKDILDTFETLKKVNTDNIMPSFHPVEIINVTRKDVIKNSKSQEEILSNTRNKSDGYFKGPKAL